MAEDPFAAAVAEVSAPDVFAAAVTDATSPPCAASSEAEVKTAKSSEAPNAGRVGMTPPSKKQDSTVVASSSAKKTRRGSKHVVTTELLLETPHADLEKNKWQTLFISSTSQPRDAQPADAESKPKRQKLAQAARQKPADCVPVTMWPQYKIRSEQSSSASTFVAVAPSEHWVITALSTLRGRGSKVNSMRVLNRNFSHAVHIYCDFQIVKRYRSNPRFG